MFKPDDKRVKQVYINDQIKAGKIMVISETGENIGTFQRDDAFILADKEGLDLVQIAYNPQEQMSTVRMCDYGKYMYEKKKEDSKKKKDQKNKGLKEIVVSYTIGEHDLQLKLKKVVELMQEGYSMKIIIKLKGREKAFMGKAFDKMKAIEINMGEYGKSQGIKSEAAGYSIVLFPKFK